MAKQPITPAEINEANREFWHEESKQFTVNTQKRPHDAVIAAEQEARMVSRLTAAFGAEFVDKAISASESIEQRVADLAKSHSASASKAAKQSRDRKSPYLAQHPEWRRAASAALAKSEDLGVPEIAGAIIKAVGTKASVRHVRSWVKTNEKSLRKAGSETAKRTAIVRP